MRKLPAILAACCLFASTSAFAVVTPAGPIPLPAFPYFSVEGASGTYCALNDVCLMAHSESDCMKAGGQAIKECHVHIEAKPKMTK